LFLVAVAVALFCPEFRLGWVGEKALPFVLTREPGRLAARSIISAFLEDRGGEERHPLVLDFGKMGEELALVGFGYLGKWV
jgi:hypothetical protein